MPDAVISEILRSSVSGAIFLLLVFAYWRKEQELMKKSEELAKANEARVSDAQQIQTALLKNNTDCVSVMRDVANAMHSQREILAEIRDSYKDFSDELRKSTRR